MRAKEFLLEAQNYDDMFKGLIKIATDLPGNKEKFVEENVRDNIKWAKQILKKNDRIVWYLRYVKLTLIEQLFTFANSVVPPGNSPSNYPEVASAQNTYKRNQPRPERK